MKKISWKMGCIYLIKGGNNVLKLFGQYMREARISDDQRKMTDGVFWIEIFLFIS